jgi:hypothetical protein
VSLDLVGAELSAYFFFSAPVAIETTSSDNGFWITSVTLGAAPDPTYQVSLASFQAYVSAQYWAVQCIATISDAAGDPVLIDTNIPGFFSVNWISMEVVLIGDGGGGGGGTGGGGGEGKDEGGGAICAGACGARARVIAKTNAAARPAPTTMRARSIAMS